MESASDLLAWNAGGLDTVLGHFGWCLAYVAACRPQGALGAILSSKVASNWGPREARGPIFVGLMDCRRGCRRGTHHPSLGATRTFGLEIEFGPTWTRLLACGYLLLFVACCLLLVAHQKWESTLGPTRVM